MGVPERTGDRKELMEGNMPITDNQIAELARVDSLEAVAEQVAQEEALEAAQADLATDPGFLWAGMMGGEPGNGKSLPICWDEDDVLPF